MKLILIGYVRFMIKQEKRELEAANLSEAFKSLKIAAYEEDLFSYNIYVGQKDKKVIGFVAFSDDELAWLYVDPSFQKTRSWE